jgi:hypothetical protein
LPDLAEGLLLRIGQHGDELRRERRRDRQDLRLDALVSMRPAQGLTSARRAAAQGRRVSR